jgi:hypothetical protein
MQPLLQHYLKGLLAPFVSALRSIKFLFAVCEKRLATASKVKNIREIKVLHAVFEYLPAACKRVIDCLLN